MVYQFQTECQEKVSHLKYYSPTVADGKTFAPVFCVL